ncbi:MAG: DUF2927 domain-containing protein [Pseudomonadota bacterium]
MARAVMALALLAACAPERQLPFIAAPKPASPELAAAVPAGHTGYDNSSLAQLFTELTHGLEWGPSRPNLVRFETPVRVSLTGPGSAAYTGFLDRYLDLIRGRARVDIARRIEAANLHIRFVEGPRFRRLLPTISCLLAPGDLSWSAFAADPDRLGGRALQQAPAISAMTIFIPQTAPPYLIRSCLIEEVAQALGPANDLYGLGPSIFNDDAAHIWPTALDLLMLRVLYDPSLTTGLGRAETERRAGAVLARINPAGQGAAPLRISAASGLGPWRTRHNRIFSKASSDRGAEASARAALTLAEREAPGSALHCHSQRTLGRVLAGMGKAGALPVLREAASLCALVHGPGDIRLSLIALEQALALLRRGSYRSTIETLSPHQDRLAELGQEERLAALLTLRARAHEGAGNRGQAAADAAQAARWRAYAYGADSRVGRGAVPEARQAAQEEQG